MQDNHNDKYLSKKDTSGTAILNTGDQLTQKEFHTLYESCGDDFRAELLNGIVYVCSMPLGLPHGTNHSSLTGLLFNYQAMTPVVELSDSTTVILSDEDEVQPDLILRILPRFSGQSTNSYKHYIVGAPELVAEVAHTSRSIDLHLKKKRYSKFGVLEYIVLCVDPAEIFWYDLRSGKLIKADEEGILKSRIYPGLWIDQKALLQKDLTRAIQVLNQGLNSAEHAEFVSRMESRKR